MEVSSFLEQIAFKFITNSTQKPSPEEVVEVLLQGEKIAKKNKTHNEFNQLIGSWQLAFITGTKKARNRGGIVLGLGRYIPNWIKIKIAYSPNLKSIAQEQSFEMGNIENQVQVGSLKLSLIGPTKFLSQKNLLIFDFTRMTVQLLGIKLYSGYIRGGKKTEETFYQERIAKQAFFAYFLITEKFIAARGKGGGLAFWIKL